MQKIDIDKTVFDARRIMELIPHRPPALLIDRIVFFDGHTIVGVKELHDGDSYFNGHFPDEPILPGVLQMEAIAQVSAVLCVCVQDVPTDYNTYLVRLDESRFRKKILPGDTMIVECELVEQLPRDLFVLKGKVFVNDDLMSETKLVAKVSKK